MQEASGPKAWDDWFRTGRINETEFFHGLVSCGPHNSLDANLAVLAEDEKPRFFELVRRLVELDKILPGQMVTSVARYSIADARQLLEKIEASS